MKKASFPFMILLLSMAYGLDVWAQEGVIRGRMLDAATGEPLMFANILVVGTNPPLGTETDMDGSYELRLPPGTYDLRASYVGYQDQLITEIRLEAGGVEVLDIALKDAGVQLEEVVIAAERFDHTEVALLTLQKKALTVQDGISAREINRYGASNVAESMKRVTGASIVDGRFIFIRGLGDRYSNAQLNGLTLPSTDPYRNSVHLDLIPADFLDNVIAAKTFTPDQPGNFAGGNVNIATQNFPERFTFKASIGLSYNTQSSFRDDFLSYEGGSTDWLGFDDGSRAIPSLLTDPAVLSELTSSIHLRARSDENLADLLNRSIKSLSPQLAPTTSRSFMDHGASISLGNQFLLGSNPLGLLVGFNFNKSYNFYDGGSFQNWELPGPGAEALNQDRDLVLQHANENPEVGGFFNLSYKIAGTHKLSYTALYNHNADKAATELSGPFPLILSGGELESRALLFKERGLFSQQVRGEHLLHPESGIKFEWGASHVRSEQEEPNLRFFANSRTVNSDGSSSCVIDQSEFPLPFYYWRDLQDEQWLAKADLSIPFLQTKSKANKLKFGVQYSDKQRTFRESRFQIQNRSNDAQDYGCDAQAYFGDANRGIVGYDETRNRYLFGLYVTNEFIPKNNYDGSEKISAAYGMVTYDIGRLRFVGGARLERTELLAQSLDTSRAVGRIQQTDLLPSLNLIYPLTDKMNLRLSASRTVARPNMREIAPFESFEFIGDFKLWGNEHLRQTRIRNFDFRWETFPKPGELLALSAYYKGFENPIVIAFIPEAANPQIRFENVNRATVYGLELELRKNLAFLLPQLKKFKLAANFSLIRSDVDMPATEAAATRELNPEKGTSRPLFGQSEFLLNTALNYQNPERGIDALLTLNVFGERLAINSFVDPDVFEQPRPELDFTFSKRLNERFSLKFRAKNLLNSDTQTTMEYRDVQYSILQYRRGRSFGLSFSYEI